MASRCRRNRRAASSQSESDRRTGAWASRPTTASEVTPFAAIRAQRNEIRGSSQP